MFARQQIWKPLFGLNPAFKGFTEKFAEVDPMSTHSLTVVGIQFADIQVAMSQDHRGNPVAALLAARVTIPREACCDGGNTDKGAAATPPCLSIGYATTLSDTMSTFHIMGRLLPTMTAHVSVNMQSQVCVPGGLAVGTDIAVVSTVRKQGKQLCYCTTDILRMPSESEVMAEMLEREAAVKSVADLRMALRHYNKLFHNSHVKAFMQQNVV